MENGSNGVVTLLFTEEELREISGVKRCDDYVEVMCGCTSHRYGDAVARLRIFSSGELEITCECTPGCTEGSYFFKNFRSNGGLRQMHVVRGFYSIVHSVFLAGLIYV